jgi:fructosamine-3-kinase
VSEAHGVAGGDINRAYRVALEDGRVVFAKSNPTAPAGFFAREAEGLAWLGDAGALRVPEVLAVGEGEGPAFLVLEWLEPAPPIGDFDVQLGRGLAALHRAGASQYGADRDNFIGTLPQDNRSARTWPRFYAERRIAPLLRRTRDAGLVSGALLRRGDRLADRMEDFAGPEEAPSRLHGDLWGGNLHRDEGGAPCLIDPAAYGGHREIDLAMMQLFGGFSRAVFDAYGEVHPLAPGATERTALYQLYPLLAHVNLFGGHYVDSFDAALGRYV